MQQCVFEVESTPIARVGEGCILCGGSVAQFLDLGRTPLANQFLTVDQLGDPEPVFPLRAGFCRDCRHVQLLDLVAPEKMFENYLYISSLSDTLRAHLDDLAEKVVKRHRLSSRDLVVDIGSNDGTLLSGFGRRGVKTLGVDPAVNLAGLARERGVDTITAYFDEETAEHIRKEYGPASAITATNSFPHIPRLDSYMRAVDALLALDGVLVIEAHYLLDLMDQCAFDTVYHEHVSYWSLGPAMKLFERHGFTIVDVERLPVHHGQIRMWVQRKGVSAVRASVQKLLAQEDSRELGEMTTYQRFASKAYAIRRDLTRMLAQFKYEGKTIAAYGAPAKGSTLLSFLDIGAETIDFIADKSPLKQGRYTPGSRIPIVGPERIADERPDYLLLLAWNFADEIMTQLDSYRKSGGKFILPVPQLRIV